ncbi:RB1-inducible coiled-coil protein 1 [Camelus ferus]|nr:RB1-inducible coiled-coil protein 1 [Camelus ferus]
MKLYVFLVNTGTTLTFDTELTVQTVADLKHAIHSKYKIAIQHQVLVVNGGECMAADRRVCTYSAGTEMYEVAKKLCSFCEGLVHDEHLQHQGWAAIMANLEDCSNSYQKLLFKFESIYSNYLQSIEDIKLKLTHLGTAVSVMAKIPLLECLTRHSYRGCLGRLGSLPEREGSEKAEVKTSAELVLSPEMPATTNKSSSASCHKSMEHVAPDPTDAESGKEIRESCQSTVQQDETSVDAKDGDLPFFNVSLLDWINVQDRPNDVESLVRKCFDSMSRLDPRIIRPFIAECRQTIANLDNQNMKAIKGLEDRLYALDQMIASCGRLVNEQKELAQYFVRSLTVLRTTSTAHAGATGPCAPRVGWCCFVMLHADQDGEKLQALLRLVVELVERVRTVEALSTVPQVYCLAVVEVVRRKMFIKHYREAELQGLEQSRRRELEGALQLRHAQEFQKLAADHQARLEKLEKESQQRIEQMQDSHAAVIQEKEQQLQELKLKVSDLSDMRCKLEVELALKEAETDEIKILLEESRAQQKETLKSLLKQETETMRTEIQQLNQKIQDNNESYQVGLAELRTLMTSEKDECISELVSRHEEESRVLRAELSRVTSSHQQACEVEKSLKGELAELQRKLDSDLSALEKEKDEKIAQQEEKYEAIIQKLEKDREKLVMSQEQEREQLLQKLTCEKAAAVQTALEGLKLEREAVEKELIEKVKHLEGQIAKSHAIESAREDSSSLVAELQEKLQEEKAKFLEQLEEQEKRKNEEMQNVRTSLIAEQQTLQLKEEENKRLNQRLVGDLVLIILDERHDNYVLFTVSPTLYFLHSESLPALDLKPGEGEAVSCVEAHHGTVSVLLLPVALICKEFKKHEKPPFVNDDIAVVRPRAVVLNGPVTFSAECSKHFHRLYHNTRDCSTPACRGRASNCISDAVWNVCLSEWSADERDAAGLTTSVVSLMGQQQDDGHPL